MALGMGVFGLGDGLHVTGNVFWVFPFLQIPWDHFYEDHFAGEVQVVTVGVAQAALRVGPLVGDCGQRLGVQSTGIV